MRESIFHFIYSSHLATNLLSLCGTEVSLQMGRHVHRYSGKAYHYFCEQLLLRLFTHLMLHYYTDGNDRWDTQAVLQWLQAYETLAFAFCKDQEMTQQLCLRKRNTDYM